MDQSDPVSAERAGERFVRLRVGGVELDGDLGVPPDARGIVIFAHGSGSSRLSPRNRFVAGELQASGLGTLLMDLLTSEEEQADAATGHLRFDIRLLATRLAGATDWVHHQLGVGHLPVGYFGASTGAAAALVAAAKLGTVGAIVSRGGRPDLAGDALEHVLAPTLLIVGGNDPMVIELNERAMRRLRGRAELVIVPGATHLFVEPGALEAVARLAREWFGRYLGRPVPATPAAS
jgi:putative phosphoribosyl transferase